jgi:hypothetical protein
MDHPTYRRVVIELCKTVGLTTPEILLAGGQLRIDDCFASFIYDEAFERHRLFVFIDLGPVTGDKEKAYEHLLKLNTELTAGARGVMSLHPETHRVLYSFQYPLSSTSTGLDLLNNILRFIGTAKDGKDYEPTLVQSTSEAAAEFLKTQQQTAPAQAQPEPQEPDSGFQWGSGRRNVTF